MPSPSKGVHFKIDDEIRIVDPFTPAAIQRAQSLPSVTSEVLDYGNENRQQQNSTLESVTTGKRTNALSGIGSQYKDKTTTSPSVIGSGNNEDGGCSPLLAIDSKKPMSDLLWQALQPDPCIRGQNFLPIGELYKICCWDSVVDELLEFLPFNEASKYATFVCGDRTHPSDDDKTSSRKVFCILVLIKQPRLLKDFMKAKVRDNDLPLRIDLKHTKLWPHHSKEDKALTFFRIPQDKEIISDFYNKQWWVQVPFISRPAEKAEEYVFEEGTIMPWIEVGEKTQRGGFGDVQEIKIHPDHHGFREHKSFALKTLREESTKNIQHFKQELSALRKMHTGTHLVELCCAFRINNTYKLLFPWAEGGSLEDMWKREPTELLKLVGYSWPALGEWMAVQCHGLVQGLRGIHHYLDKRPIPGHEEPLYGIHYDIKPDNILWFSQDTRNHPLGSLKIADFGLTKFHRKESRTMVLSNNTPIVLNQTYRSPEHDNDKTISRKVDIWALGCVFSELLSWLVLGPKGRKEYEDKRLKERPWYGHNHLNVSTEWREDNFFVNHFEKQLVENGTMKRGKAFMFVASLMRRAFMFVASLMRIEIAEPKVVVNPKRKESVSQWLDKLIVDSGVGTADRFIREFCWFVKEQMLEPHRTQRVSSEQVQEFLKKCLNKGGENPEYWSLSPSE